MAERLMSGLPDFEIIVKPGSPSGSRVNHGEHQ
jgi:hypothetical protein